MSGARVEGAGRGRARVEETGGGRAGVVARVGAWALLAATVGAQVAYPLVGGAGRARLVVATVVLGFLASVWHAGPRYGPRLVAVTAGGGLLVEAVGVATGFPFGTYAYGDALGPKVAGVPVVVPLAWTWMAWPAWLVAARLARDRVTRVVVAAVGLAGWDLFLDPQMVAAGYWAWSGGKVPVTNYLGWLVVAAAMMACLPAARERDDDGPMVALYLWTYGSSVLAHAVFLHLPASAVLGGLGMGLVAIPLAVRLARR